jgi:hypothetical protein
MDMIDFTRKDLWIDQEENEIEVGTEIEGGAND